MTIPERTPQLPPVWGQWRIASGAGCKRTWWIVRENRAIPQYSPNGAIYHYQTQQPLETADGKLRRYASHTTAQKAAETLNNHN